MRRFEMKLKEKGQAIILRKQGYSLKEIAQKLCISKSTASLWLRGMELSGEATNRLSRVVSAGQLKSANNKKERTRKLLDQYYQESCNFLSKLQMSPDFSKISCSLIYWCEGSKSDNNAIRFTNSDPKLMAGFLALLRRSYLIDEKKFRACLHVHEYHDLVKQLDFWSKVTQIPTSQFMKPYLKPHTGTRIRENYQGCLQVRYYDADVSRQVIMLAKAFFENYRSLI